MAKGVETDLDLYITAVDEEAIFPNINKGNAMAFLEAAMRIFDKNFDGDIERAEKLLLEVPKLRQSGRVALANTLQDVSNIIADDNRNAARAFDVAFEAIDILKRERAKAREVGGREGVQLAARKWGVRAALVLALLGADTLSQKATDETLLEHGMDWATLGIDRALASIAEAMDK